MAGSSMAAECSLAAVRTWLLSALLRDPQFQFLSWIGGQAQLAF